MAERIGVIIPPGLRDRLFAPEDRRRLEGLGEVAWAEGELDAAGATRLLAGCSIALGSWGTAHPATDGLLAACPRLRLWEHVAGSVKHMFGPQLAGRDLTIASCKGAIADCVAEQVLGTLIVGLRGLLENAAANRAGPAGAPAGMRVLAASTIGVVGASEVGRRVLRLLRPFGARLLCFDPHADRAGLAALGAEGVDDLAAMCARCDAVTLHTPLLPATAGMIGARELAAMRDGTLFINTARGECVDEPALVRELASGRLRAWLDVTSPEPAAVDSPLRRLPNVVLTSHLAGPATVNLGRQAVDDVAAFLAGGVPQCVITSDMLARVA